MATNDKPKKTIDPKTADRQRLIYLRARVPELRAELTKLNDEKQKLQERVKQTKITK